MKKGKVKTQVFVTIKDQGVQGFEFDTQKAAKGFVSEIRRNLKKQGVQFSTSKRIVTTA